MKISYNWLKDYIKTDLTVNEIAEILTQTGLEVGSIELSEQIKGSLQGVVVGEVIVCEKHPNSDHLNLTQVSVGTGDLLPIVCGAPNVAQGQKIMVATVGTVLYNGDQEFAIKKAKLRGEVSMGMICSETELSVGTDSSGILVLPTETKVGTTAKDFFKLGTDYCIEIDLTPNRIDGASHIGVARDLAAYLQTKGQDISYTLPPLNTHSQATNSSPINIIVENSQLCPRYMGVCLDNIKIAPSPQWLQDRLKTIGATPINNVVDITNYVLFETGQPLHAFDRAKIGDTIIVKTLNEVTKFTTLDDVERTLSTEDLIINSASTPLCIAGVFGGLDSGVSASTTKIFLESAYFNPVSVRKTARRHGLNTDASFRFERGVDPNMIPFALQRAINLFVEIAGAKIVSDIQDYYPQRIEDNEIILHLSQVNRLTGLELNIEEITTILQGLEIEILKNDGNSFVLKVPAYRVDVTREADVIEEILRIYGYDNIPVKQQVSSVLSYSLPKDPYALRNKISNYLSNKGFTEIMNNSLSKSSYYENNETFPIANSVVLKNPLSIDLNVMRQTLLYGGLETIAYNCNRKRNNLFLYEFGRIYSFNNEEANNENPLNRYAEKECLSLFLTGNLDEISWNNPQQTVSFFHLKAYIYNILQKLGIATNNIEENYIENQIFQEGLSLEYNKKTLATIGILGQKTLKKANISQSVLFGEINWNEVLAQKTKKISYTPLPKYPEVRRDFSLLLDKNIDFSAIKNSVEQTERKLLKAVNLFDVYTGDKLPQGKKSYAISIILQDENKTLTDKQIDKISTKIQQNLNKQFGAVLR